ncbi:MAG TPA: tetratricopeptide repeat protein [Opitutaceae bacterium]|nr:tetratricopeptide repeat protein [Opitutaceae bacterium]
MSHRSPSSSVAPPTPATSGTPPERYRPAWLLIAIVFAAVLAAYLPVWHAGFIWDDDSNLTANPCIVGPLGFAGIWTSPAGFYFPLVTTCLWVQHALWGLAPTPYHVVNVLFHVLGAVLLWLVLRRLRTRGACFGAMLWALHPVQVESVAWISELKNTQSGVFYLLSIWFFLRWVEAEPAGARRAKAREYALALLCAILAILSKTSTVMLPVVLGLCWWWMRGRWRWRYLLWLLPFLVVSVTASAWTIWEQKFHSGALGQDWNQSLLERVVLSGRVFWFYLGKLLWPHPLIFIYPRWSLDATRAISYVPVLAAVGGLGLLWWRRQGRLRPVFFAATVFGVTLFPVLGFFNVFFFRYSFVGDHFQYLASMAALALAGAGLVTAGGWLGQRRPWLAAVPGGVLLVGLGLLTWRQSQDYPNNETLWRATLAANPQCWMAHYNLGTLWRSTGRTRDAIAQFERALQIKADMPDAQTALGSALEDAGRGDEAIAHYEQALRLDPHFTDAHNDLGLALAAAGRLPEAIAHYEQALQINPALADVHNNLGSALRAAGRAQEAIAHYEEALRLKPDYAAAHNNLGNAFREADRLPEAIAQYEQALQIAPAVPEVRNNLGIALLLAGRTQDAIAQFEAALRLNPDLAQVHLNLAAALESAGRTDEAATQYEAARRLGLTVPLPGN